MKKINICVFIFALSVNCLIGQVFEKKQIKYVLYGKEICDNLIKRLDIYFLWNDSIFISSLDTVPILLPDTGYYKLQTSYTDPQDTVSVYISEYGLNSDTIIIESISNIIAVLHGPQIKGWYCCDKKCNGYQIDYYNNGNKRIEGYFKKGKAIGEIKYYNADGTLSTILYYNKRGKYLRRKDFVEKL